MRIAIIGAGNVGSTLAVLLRRAGHEIVGIASRSASSAAQIATKISVPFHREPAKITHAADVICITTPDRAIADVCMKLSVDNGINPGAIVIHTSGAHSSEILSSAVEKGAYPLSFHPLQTFPSPEAGIKNLPGSFITIEGHTDALPIGRRLVQDLHCKLLEIPTAGKPLYHTAAVIACNYLTTLTEAALQTLETAGINREDGLQALYPLIAATLSNISQSGTTEALTGPIARGDAATIKTHLDYLRAELPAILPLYTVLGQATLILAAAKGTLTENDENEIYNLLRGKKPPLQTVNQEEYR